MKTVSTIILEGYKALGLELKPTSRIAIQIDSYLDKRGVLPQILEPDHPLFQTALEALRDLNQIGFSLDQLLPVCPADELARRFSKLLQDNTLPQDSPTKSPGRDAQLEVFIAALCARAGLAPVFDESPDIRCNLNGDVIGIAVKRIKSTPDRFPDRLRERVREATKQIERSKLPGIIAVDISQSLNPTNWRVPMEVSDAHFTAIFHATAARFRARFEKSLLESTAGTGVRGMVVFDHVPRCAPNGKWHFELMCWTINLCPFNQRRRREFDAFDRRFSYAVNHPGTIL